MGVNWTHAAFGLVWLAAGLVAGQAVAAQAMPPVLAMCAGAGVAAAGAGLHANWAAHAARQRMAARLDDEMAALRHSLAETAGETARLHGELAGLRALADRGRAAPAVSGQLRALAKALDLHVRTTRRRLDDMDAAGRPAPTPGSTPAATAATPASASTPTATLPTGDAPRAVPASQGRALLDSVRAALDANSVELHVQPIVSLPQRRTFWLEGFARLRDPGGGLILPGHFLPVAEPAGLIGEIDTLLVWRSVEIARRLIRRDRRVGLFCNLSPASLSDPHLFRPFADFLAGHRDLAGALVFELPQRGFLALEADGQRHMAALARLGFRFSVDRCETLDMDLERLERSGVRHVKMAGDRLVQALGQPPGAGGAELARHVAPSDLPALFARHGIGLIADRVERERLVPDLIDLDIGFAQGHVFGPPRPARPADGESGAAPARARAAA